MQKSLKLKKCSVCNTKFSPYSSLSKTCSVPCSIESVALAKDKQERRRTRVKKKALRERKKALKSRSTWLAEAQTAFNAYIRARDAEDPCISCEMYVNDSNLITGSRWDCGHYLTRGAYPELRFSELNAHKQCTSCNGGAGKYVKKNLTVTQQYRINLINKVGIKNVEWLEGPHIAQNWSIEDIQEIKEFYKQKLKEVK